MAEPTLLIPCTYCGAELSGSDAQAQRLNVLPLQGPILRFCNWDCLAAYAVEQGERRH